MTASAPSDPWSDVGSRFDRFAKLAARLLSASSAVLVLRTGHEARVLSAHGLPPATLGPIPAEQILDELLVVPDVALAAGPVPLAWARLDRAARSLAIAPLRNARGLVVGALAIFSTQRRRWSTPETEQIEELAATCGEMLATLGAAREERRIQSSDALLARQLGAPAQGLPGMSGQYRALARNLPEGVVVLYDRDLRVTLATVATLASAGFRVVEGSLLVEAIPCPIRDRVVAACRAALQGEAAALELEIGEAAYLVRVQPVRSEEGELIGGMILANDVTKHAADERARRESEARYRLLFERARDSICVVRIHDRAPPTIVDANPATVALYGYTLDELVGMTLTDLDAPCSVDLRSARFRPLVEDGEWVEFEAEGRRKNGTTFPVEISAGPLDPERRLVLVAARDVSQRREAEARYRLLFERARDGIAIFQLGPGGPVVIEANEAAARLHGYRPDELKGMRLAALRTPLSFAGAEPLLAALETNAEPVQVEMEALRKDGTTFPIEVSDTPLDLGRGLVLAFWRDVAERRSAQAALVAAKEAAEQANRAKSAFLANMSHEIRTPMNAILGYAQVLRRAQGLSGPHREGVEVIGRNGEHLLALINDILDVSKIEAGMVKEDRSDVDLHGIVGDVEAMFRQRASAKGIGFEVVRYTSLPRWISADEVKLRQILVNLIGNAIKFTERGGVVTRLRSRATEEGAALLVVEVEDTGPGIAPDELGLLFRPFGQTRAGIHARGGTGLGLVISREYARLMGGDVLVQSRHRVGTVFTLELPLLPGRVTMKPPPRPTGRVVGVEARPRRARVLIVDDDADNRAWVLRLLQDVGFEVREAEDEASALALLEEFRPSLVLLDTTMPRLDGGAIIRRMRERDTGRASSIVALTSTLAEGERGALLAAGADGFLLKPCREDALFAEMRRLLGIEYRYAPERPSAEGGAFELSTLKARCRRELPACVRQELLEAAYAADYDHLLNLLASAHVGDGVVLDALRGLVETYSYDALSAVVTD